MGTYYQRFSLYTSDILREEEKHSKQQDLQNSVEI